MFQCYHNGIKIEARTPVIGQLQFIQERDDESLSEDTDSGNGEKGKYMKDIKEEELTAIKSDWVWRIREQEGVWMTPSFLAWTAVWMKVLIKVGNKGCVWGGQMWGGRTMGRMMMSLILDVLR